MHPFQHILDIVLSTLMDKTKIQNWNISLEIFVKINKLKVSDFHTLLIESQWKHHREVNNPPSFLPVPKTIFFQWTTKNKHKHIGNYNKFQPRGCCIPYHWFPLRVQITLLSLPVIWHFMNEIFEILQCVWDFVTNEFSLNHCLRSDAFINWT